MPANMTKVWIIHNTMHKSQLSNSYMDSLASVEGTGGMYHQKCLQLAGLQLQGLCCIITLHLP